MKILLFRVIWKENCKSGMGMMNHKIYLMKLKFIIIKLKLFYFPKMEKIFILQVGIILYIKYLIVLFENLL